jgi:hypothetical protein
MMIVGVGAGASGVVGVLVGVVVGVLVILGARRCTCT